MTRQPPSILSAGAVSTIDTLLAGFRTSTCVIERNVGTKDKGGAKVDSWEAVGSPVPCKVKAPGRSPTEQALGGSITPMVDYEVKLPRNTEVHNDWRIQVNGRTLYVVADRDAETSGFQDTVLTKAGKA